SGIPAILNIWVFGNINFCSIPDLNLRKTSEPHGECPPTVPPLFSQMRFSESDLSLNRAHWITETFNRRECARFIPTNKYPEK
ncbi:hypothetical protein GCK32_020545, partial [Trichostrongylus colubriformis]